ncbi:MAG TPA: prolyl oligopeptidase family serine peptidase, partial [Longimicrobiales bacterium]|nr:prolyl oligopeptidase family serine peptidase [Longimicrobiales bacterium]
RTDKSYATLDYMSPDGNHFLVPRVTELSTLALMSKETYRLAGLELRPRTNRQWHLDTWGIHDFRFYSLDDRRFVEVDLPEGSFASDFTWSADGARVAFLAHLPSHTEAWTADVATGRARRLSSAPVMATLGTGSRGQGSRPSDMLQWTPEGTVITLLVPEDRGAEPARSRIPTSPTVRRTRDGATTTRTYPFLLEDAHDELLFEHYTRARIAELREGRRPRPLGEPGMYQSLSLSPDGRHILASRIERPFSYITNYSGFPRVSVVLDRDGREVATLEERGLREGGGGDDGGGAPRDFAWRPDGAGISYLQRAPRDTAAADDAPRPDRIMLLAAPFDPAAAVLVAESEDPIRSVTYTLDGRRAFATVSKGGRGAVVHWDLTQAAPERRVLVDFHSGDDPLKLPGDLLTARTANGLTTVMVSSDGTAAYLEGDGYQADFRPRPFIDRVALDDGAKERVFEGTSDSFDQPLVPLDAELTRMIASRESKTDFPDSYLWTREGGFGANLTNNVDPFPRITAAARRDFAFTRRDGLVVQGRVSLPVGWTPGQRVPAIFWTYPREYEKPEEYERAAIRARNQNAFTHLSWLRWSDFWLTQGYALVYPDIPIVGENYNDTYIASLVDAMYGAIRAVDSLGVVDIDRIGHGGHSYGAFATANVLANAPFFKAGIAGDGAYNRSLTPTGFQAERRAIWEAPHTYIAMSPFFKAHQIDTPLLMYHGADDDNTGTFPLQSRRMIHALTALGKTAVLYEYPYESHTPRAIENKLDMWARFIGWFDRYVKGEGEAGETVSSGQR